MKTPWGESEWNRALVYGLGISGRAATDFTRYTIQIMAEVGLLVHHKKFGDGVIADVLEDLWK